MPFVRIDLHHGKSKEELSVISRSIHQAMVETIDVPEDDYFQVITPHPPGELLYDTGYMNISRSEQQMFVQITMKEGRPLRKKQALYARMTELLEMNAKVRPQDVMIILTENTQENWSFGNGVAQLAPEA
ncbi:tautomerase family protein [Paenibacillus sp. FSL M7-1455]|jgi:phenylpyruvate tautomerase PptA (4-oxalocrotonate tautomerase family)|uniref:Tautomerase YusQ n=1 Tax=Paenibacillus cookii TaxID=157839 RepID=A0ABQ4M1A4_9BACL|nr:tautomerase family protein [Paenibacillus cookii]KHF31891.1 4-oxalocrotonate tautomerase [Paenibacillus sp. P1XP2]GIO69224.1 putative tautomerase YusQ [Paenibacillus cookii]HWO55263.1 tautomerase family protein [Paenibacillus cookii]